MNNHPILIEAPAAIWLPTDLFREVLRWIGDHPSAWLGDSRSKYIEIRFDSRMGNGYLYSTKVEVQGTACFWDVRPEVREQFNKQGYINADQRDTSSNHS